MRDLFKIIIPILLSIVCISCDDSQIHIVELEDTWEGERLYISAIMNVNEPLSVSISRTVNPILDSLPLNLEITEATVYMMVDDTLRVDYSFDFSSNQYINDYIILPNQCYQLFTDYDTISTFSSVVCIPDVNIDLVVHDVEASQAGFSMNAEIDWKNVDAYLLRIVEGFYPAPSRMQYNFWDNFVSSESDCENKGNVDLTCLGEGPLQISFSTTFASEPFYTFSEDHNCILGVTFQSRELEDIRNSNRYTTGEFDLLGTFNSNFEDAYGVFAYEFTTQFVIPFK